MAEAMEKSGFLRRVRQSRARWDQLMGQVASGDRERPGFSGEWSLKQVMAHIVWYEREMIRMLEASSFAGSPHWELPLDERNARIHDEMEDLDLAEVSALAARTAERLLELLEALPESALNDPAAFPGMPAEWKPWEVLASNTYEHYDDHAQGAEAWLALRGRGTPAAAGG